MKRTIRLMTWLAVASATPVAFADSNGSATKEEGASEKQMVVPTRADDAALGTADEGGGRGELPGQAIERHDRADTSAADKRAKEVAAIKEYNERKFLEEVWTRP